MVDSYYTHSRPEMQPYVPEGAESVLDIGCGAGEFGAALKDRRSDLRVVGVELDPVAAGRARERLDLVLPYDVARALDDLEGQQFDAIVLNDVLEHVVEPEELLQRLAPLLSEDGRLVASIPNVREFFTVCDLVLRGKWEYRDEGILDRTHLRFFTRSSLPGLFGRGGFELELVEGINHTGSWKFRIFNALSLGRFRDMGYLQWACVARRTA